MQDQTDQILIPEKREIDDGKREPRGEDLRIFIWSILLWLFRRKNGQRGPQEIAANGEVTQADIDAINDGMRAQGVDAEPIKAQPKDPAAEIIELRLKLKEAGYHPIPVNGKAPCIDEWQKQIDVSDEVIKSWKPGFDAYGRPCDFNIGLLTIKTPTFDSDIRNAEAADAVEQLARETFSGCGKILKRIGAAPKFAIPFAPKPHSKRSPPVWSHRMARKRGLSFSAMGNSLSPSASTLIHTNNTGGMAKVSLDRCGTMSCR